MYEFLTESGKNIKFEKHNSSNPPYLIQHQQKQIIPKIIFFLEKSDFIYKKLYKIKKIINKKIIYMIFRIRFKAIKVK